MERARRCWAPLALALALGEPACASSSPNGPKAPTAADDAAAQARRLDEFTRIEGEALDWIAASDPRLALRAHVVASDEVLAKIGTAAVLAEDATAQIRNRSLDLFAFRARAHALEEASSRLEKSPGELPDVAPPGGILARPRLERELLRRLVEEERARAADEGSLGDASGDLVRGILETWTPLASPQDLPERDAWVSRRLLQIRDSLRSDRRVTGPLDVDVALYPLERLLAPLQYPKGAAAIAEVRVTLDADPRAAPPRVAPERIAQGIQIHLGLQVDPATLTPRLEHLEAALRDLAEHALDGAGPGKPAALSRAREMLLSEAPCPAVAGTRVRSMAPPPERSAVCGALHALSEEGDAAATLAALHDDVILALAATTTPPPRTRLLSKPDDDVVDTLERAARERPIVALGVALAAEIIFAPGSSDVRIRTWRALGDTPLDVMAREVEAAVREADAGAPALPPAPAPKP
jgi:hypothetical protein